MLCIYYFYLKAFCYELLIFWFIFLLYKFKIDESYVIENI